LTSCFQFVFHGISFFKVFLRTGRIADWPPGYAGKGPRVYLKSSLKQKQNSRSESGSGPFKNLKFLVYCSNSLRDEEGSRISRQPGNQGPIQFRVSATNRSDLEAEYTIDVFPGAKKFGGGNHFVFKAVKTVF
jgi:hypothetical protein